MHFQTEYLERQPLLQENRSKGALSKRAVITGEFWILIELIKTFATERKC